MKMLINFAYETKNQLLIKEKKYDFNAPEHY